MKQLYSMTRFFLISLFFLVCSLKLEAQIRDLANMAEGELEFYNILYDSDDKIFGYFYIFKQGDIDGRKSQYEYVFLDKNLNKAANGKFEEDKEEGSFRTVSDYIGAKYMGDGSILLSKYFIRYSVNRGNSEFIVNYNRIISIKDKTVSPAFACDDDNRLVDLSEDVVEVRKKYTKHKTSNFIRGINTGGTSLFLVTQSSRKKEREALDEKEIKAFNINKSPLWTYVYNEEPKVSEWDSFSFLDINESTILIDKQNLKRQAFSLNWLILSRTIVALDIKTGKPKFEYLMEDKDATYSHTIYSRKTYNNKYYLIGDYSLYSKKGYDWEKSLGIYQIVLDDKGNELSKKYFTWAEIATDLQPNKYGKLKDGYMLITKSVFQFKNGSFSILTEKYKEGKSGMMGLLIPIPIVNLAVAGLASSSSKSTDFDLFNFDAQANFKEKHVIEKDRNKNFHNDYLFSQSIKEDNGVVFFFRDYKKDEKTKEKNWILGINTIINGEFKQEIIPMSSEDFSISPMRAKEGYILLREYNEKSKYNQLRLEKLNY